MHAQTTVCGHLTRDPEIKKLPNGSYVCSMRVASSRRVQKSETNEWIDVDQLFVDVECWGDLAKHAVVSLAKGRPVMCLGYLHTQSWGEGEQKRSKTVLRAHHVGLELGRYVASSKKVTPEDAIVVEGLELPDEQEINRGPAQENPREEGEETKVVEATGAVPF